MISTDLCRECQAPVQCGAKFCAACGQEIAPVSQSERRQLTVLFCDVVGSTTLSERLDPEDLRDLLAAYQRVCRDVVGHYEGHISQFLGDGVMSYFGYPIAHEDDPVRAIRAALRILQGVKLVTEGIGRRLKAEIQIRVGIHTGLAVVGEVGPGGAHDRLAVGQTVNLAARIQGFAEVGTAVVSASTARLVHGHFELESLGMQRMRGFTQPIELYRVVRTTGARTKFEATARAGLTPHVGREREWAQLTTIWEEVREGADRVVVIRGEAGIGKSRIVHQFRHAVRDEPARVFECFCAPSTQSTAFAPVVEMIDQNLVERGDGDATPASRFEALRGLLAEHSRLGPDALPRIAALLSLPGADEGPIQELSPVRRRARTLEILREWLGSTAERLPVALLVEDAHWADPSTLDLLDLVVRQSPGGRTLVCVTGRPEFLVRWSGPHVHAIELSRLSDNDIASIVRHVAGGNSLPALVAKQIAERSEGVPLFIEEVTKAVLESGALRLESNRYEAMQDFEKQVVPPTVHASLMARFDRLGESRTVAQLGAAIGREFTYRLIRAVTDMPDEDLGEHLDRLRRSELVFVENEPPHSNYKFKHALIQDAIYGTMLKKNRSQVHERVFSKLKDQFPEILQTRPEMAAYHAEGAGRRDVAVPLLRDAAIRALGGNAVTEAARHLSRAIELVDALEEPARTSMEMELQAAIGPAYMATLGWAAPEVERSSERLRDLARARGDGARLFQAMWGLWTVHFLRGRLDSALEVAREVLGMASGADPILRVAGHHAVGYTHFYRGEYDEALRHADEGLALFDLEREKRIASLFQLSSSGAMWCFRAEAQQMLGLAHIAALSMRNWEKLTEELGHTPSRALLLCQQCRYFHMLDDVDRVEDVAMGTRSLSISEGFAMWVPIADIFLAWTSARQGHDANAAVDKIRSAKAVLHAGLTHLGELEFTSILAEVLLIAGRPEEVFPIAEAALAITSAGKQRDYEPEVFRFQAEAARILGDIQRAVSFYRLGIESARTMGCRSLELRSALGLARLTGGAGGAQDELASILDGFTEGFDQPDVKEGLALVSSSHPDRRASSMT